MTSDILIYQNQDGNIKIDVRLQEETVWLTQAQMGQLFGKDKRTISEHISNIFSEGELEENSVVRKFRTVQTEGTREMKDWIQRLDSILQLNGRELFTHAGKISYEMALKKSTDEFEKYKISQKAIEKEQSLKEIEEDIKKLKKSKK